MLKLHPSPRRLALLVVLALSVILNAWLLVQWRTVPSEAVAEILKSEQYPFLAKRIFVTNQNDLLINFVGLRQQLRQYTEAQPEQLGVYFEYLPSGVSIGLNEKENYLLASLLKVPLVMAVEHQIAQGKLQPTQQLTVQPDDIDPFFGNLWQQGPGTQLTVAEAIRLVLIESDNTAKNLLMRTIELSDLSAVFDYLDIPKESEANGPVVSPKNYSSILRSLYLSSYLPLENSSRILATLTESTHNNRLRAPIPSEVPVAHKIGVFESEGPDPDIYTDCGIVYLPKRPYLLCIMTQSEEDKATRDMQALSRIVYEYVRDIN